CPHHHVLVLELRLARGQAGSRLEADGDGRATLGEGIPGEPDPKQRRQNRHDPHQWHATSLAKRRRKDCPRFLLCIHLRHRPACKPGTMLARRYRAVVAGAKLCRIGNESRGRTEMWGFCWITKMLGCAGHEISLTSTQW